MANDIIDLSSSSQTKVSNQDFSNSIDKESTKDKPSLFDSLLKESNQVAEQKEISATKVEQKEETSNIQDVQKKQEVEKTQENLSDNKLENKTQNSLLDRLVLESKEKIKNSSNTKIVELTTNLESLPTDSSTSSILDGSVLDGDISKVIDELKNSDKIKVANLTTNLESLPTDNSVISTIEINGETDISKLQELEKGIKKLDLDKKTEDKAQNSLLDKLLLEVKEEINSLNKGNVDTSISTNNEASITTDVPLLTDSEEIYSVTNISEELIKTNSDELIKSINTVIKNSNSEIIKEDKVTIDSILENSQKNDKKQSLMDLLIQKNSKTSQLDITNSSLNFPTEQTKDFLSSIYLGNQKNVVNNQLLLNKNEAINLLNTGNAKVQDVEKSANLLELGLNSVTLEQTESSLEVTKQQVDLISKKSLLDKLLSEKNVKSEEIKNIITQSKEASSALLDNTININNEDTVVNVNSPLSYNIQSKIIGAKQQMSTMMSDIARQMYENYRPPVTVFKINLNPLELGSISILMKNDKNNSLNISMNISNTTTLNAIMENQNILKSALNSTFDENTNFSLDFSSGQNGNQSSKKEQNQQNSSQSSNQEHDEQSIISTQAILQMKDENKEEDKLVDYM